MKQKPIPTIVALCLLFGVSVFCLRTPENSSHHADSGQTATRTTAAIRTQNQIPPAAESETQRLARLSPPSWRPPAVFAETATPTPPPAFPRGENATRRYHQPVNRDLDPALAANPPTVLAKSPQDGRFNLLPEEIDEHTKVARRMVFDPVSLDQIVAGKASRLLAPTPSGEVLALDFTKIKTRSANTHTLQGHVAGEESTSIAQIVYHDGILHGTVMRYDTNQEIEYRILTDGHMMVRELDHSTMSDSCATCQGFMADMEQNEFPNAPAPANSPEDGEIVARDTPGWRVVDVVVGYSQEARVLDGGVSQIEARIIDEVDRMTLAFANSGIANTEMMLLGTIEDPDYVAPGTSSSSLGDELTNLRNESDGVLDTVTNLSNRLGADMVSFVTPAGQGGQGGVANSGNRYTINSRASMTASQMVFAHELGHNMGCAHAWGDSGKNTGSNTGWRFKTLGGTQLSTIMAYTDGWGARVPHYSNPDVFYDGVRTGAVNGYNATGDTTVDQRLVVGGLRFGPTDFGFDGNTPTLGANNAEVIDAGVGNVNYGATVASNWATRTAFGVISPAAAAQWERGTTQTIQFNGGDMKDLAVIKLYKGGVLHSTLASGLNPANNRNFLWTVPFALTDGTDYMIRVELDRNGSTLTADSGVFTIFSDPPYVISASAPAVPEIFGQISKVVLTFNVPMNPATFSAGSDIVSFTDPVGNSVMSSITGTSWSAGNTVLTINFTPPTQPGTYQLVVGPDIADTVGSLMDQDGDGATGETVDDRYTAQFTVNPPVIYYANMDSDPGWTFGANNPATNGWAYGQPTGQGANPYRYNDPNSGFTGPNVVGYNLSGDYQTNIPDTRWATAPAFDCSGQKNVTLSFKRWLGVSAGDYAYIQVSDNGTSWTTVWQNPSNADLDDNAWASVDYDISAVADGKATVYVRWGLGRTFTDINGGASGWNIDDVIVHGTLTDNLAVTPAGGLDSSGVAGGPFSPSSIQYTLQNTGLDTLQWTAGKTADWVGLSATSGTLASGASTTVTVSINSNADEYQVGNYSDLVIFTNATTGLQNTTRSVNLTVLGPGTLEVSPADTFTYAPSGSYGGAIPFSPASTQYTLTNAGVTSINWTAAKTQGWLTLSATSGTLAPLTSTTVTVSLNANANALSPGVYTDSIAFLNTTNEGGNTSRAVSLTVNPSAASFYWDSNGSTAGAGGTPTGTWGTSNFWNNDAAGTAGTFTNTTANTADLFLVAAPASNSGTGNATITVSGAQAANSLTSQHSGSFTLSGGTSLTLGNTTAGQGGITVNEFAFGSTVQGKLTISTPVILSNSQTWTNNKVDTSALQQTAGLDLTASSANSLTLSSPLIIDGKGVTSFSANAATTITGTGSIAKNGTGTLIISTAAANNSAWSGGLTINGGKVRYQDALNLGTGNINIANGVLEGRSSGSVSSFSRDLGAGANQMRITGGVSGFSAQNSTTTTFAITGTTPLVWGSANFNPSEFVLQASTASATSAATFTSNINLSGAERTIRSDQPGSLTSGGVATVSGAITGTGTSGIIKAGPGHIYFTGSNTYTGNTRVNNGTLTYNSIGAAPGRNTSGAIIVAGGATLGINAGTYASSSVDTLRNNVTWSDKTSRLGFMTATAGLTYSSNITQELSIHKYGGSTTGALALSGSSSYTGHTIISQGILAFNSIANVGGGNSALGAPATAAFGTIALGGDNNAVTLRYTGTGHSTDRVINLTGTTGTATLEIAGTGTLTCTSPFTATGAGSKTLTLTGSTAGTGVLQGAIPDNSSTNTTALTKTGSGTWELYGSSSYTGKTTISQGSLVFSSIANVSGGNSALGAPATAANGTIALGNGGNNVALRYTGTGHSTNRVINLAGTTGSATLDMSGTNTLTFTSALTATGAGAKTLTLTGSTAGIGELQGAIVNNSGTFTTSLSKTGTGIWRLSGGNTYTGTTAVSAGKLFINGNQSTASGEVSVSGLATLGGTGTLGGNITIADTGKLEFSLSTAPVSHDKLELAAAKTLSFGANATLTINSVSGATTGDYTLISAPGGIGTLPAFTLNLPSGWSASVTRENSDTDLVLHVTSLGATVDHFAISSIASPQTIGTPITGITITAQDVTNQTATSFTGTVTFGGTAGITGTSANFVAGVLTGVSVTPNVAGADLTFVVDDGAGHLGTATFTVLTPYAAWANGFLPTDVSDTAGNPDSDPLDNLQEFAFGTDPTIGGQILSYTAGGAVSSAGAPIAVNLAGAGGVDYRAIFTRRKDHAAVGLTYTVQFSADMTSWVTSAATPAILTGDNTQNPGNIEAVSVPYPLFVAVTGGGFKKPTFFRVVVSMP